MLDVLINYIMTVSSHVVVDIKNLNVNKTFTRLSNIIKTYYLYSRNGICIIYVINLT